jgi:hypothetical protein
LHRRRIERYAQLLDEASGARRHHARSPVDHELANMLAVNQALADASPDLAPTDAYRTDARAQIMAAAERLGVGRTYREPTDDLSVSAAPAVGRASVGTVHESASRRGLLGTRTTKPRISANRSRTRGAILVGLAVGTLALSGISAASGDAMPGSALYGMKRASENAQISLASSNAAAGKLNLEDAQTRVAEAQQISSNRRALAGLESTFTGVIATMNNQTNSGVQLLFDDAIKHRNGSDLDTVVAFVTYQQKQLDNLSTEVSGDAADTTLVRAAGIKLDLIRSRADEIRAVLPCSSSLKITGHDPVGPVVVCENGASGPIGATLAYRTDGSTGTTVSTGTASYDGGLLGSVRHLLGGL